MRMKKLMESYKPQMIYEESDKKQAYGIMLVKLIKCNTCNKYMIVQPKNNYLFIGTFPQYFRLDFNTQVKNAGWEINSNDFSNEKPICKTCVENGKAIFICSLCEKEKSTDLIQESFGDPSEYLCKECYETVAVKIWEKTVKKLNNKHRYDFE